MAHESISLCNKPILTDLPLHLSRLSERFESLDPELAGIASHLRDLRDRLQIGQFHLAVLGQFKRGKSTLLNALLGEEVLPTAVVPLTSIPTFLRYGQELRVTVHFHKGEDFEGREISGVENLKSILSRYVTEGENPGNRLGVAHVEVILPAPILRNGLVFIDTPGIGSTFRHNTEATLNFLPQCDAAMFLISADPPITEVELEFLRRVQEKVPRLFFILNKVDYLSQEDRESAVEFFRKMLIEHVGVEPEVMIFCLSARNGLEAKQSGAFQLLEESGLQAVEEHLIDFLVSEKSQALHQVVQRRSRELADEGLMCLRLEKQSLEMPLKDLKQRLEEFGRGIEQGNLQRQSAGDMLSGDCKRMLEVLEEHADRLREESRRYLEGVVQEKLMRSAGQNISEASIQSALAEAIPVWFEHQSGVFKELFRERMAEVLNLHQEKADQLIEGIRKKAADLFEIPYRAPESSSAFEVVREPYWITSQWSSSALNPIPSGFFDGLFPQGMRKRRVLNRVDEQIHSLVLSNVENLRWSTHQSINESFRRFGSALDQRLAETIKGTQGAIQAAMEKRARCGETVREKITLLNQAICDLVEIEDALGGE